MTNRPPEFDAKLMAYLPALKKQARNYPDVMDADELVQSTVLYILERWEGFRGDFTRPNSGFLEWLRYAMRGHVSNLRAKRKIPLADDPEGRLLGNFATPASQEDAVDLAGALDMLARMPHGDNLLRFVAGEDQPDIAAADGVSRQAVSLRVARARQDLRAGRITKRPYNRVNARSCAKMVA